MDLAAAIEDAAPDVVLIDSDAPGRDTLEYVCVASEHSDRPVVMFTGDGTRAAIRDACRRAWPPTWSGTSPPPASKAC